MRGAEYEQGDLAGGEDTERRAPEAGAAAGVEEGAGAVVAEAGEGGLVDADQVVEGPDLAAVGVAGELEVDAGGCCPVDELGLVGQEQHGVVGVGAVQGSGEVGAVAGEAGGLGRDVIHAGDHEGVATAFEQQMAVAQRFPAQLVHQVDPALGLAVVLVVAGDVDPGQGGSHGAEWGGLGVAAFGCAVRDVSGVADQIGLQRVDRLADPCRPAGAVERAVAGVGDEDDAHAVQPGPHARELYVELAHPWHPAGLGVPPGEQHGGCAEDRPSDDPGPVLTVAYAGHG